MPVTKILVVDDSRSARFFVKSCLPESNVEVHEAENGIEAIAQYEKIRPDLVFLDLTMPEMDGFATLPKLYEIDPSAKVVVLTADIQRKTIERIERMGVVHFLKKPPKRETIAEALRVAFPNGPT